MQLPFSTLIFMTSTSTRRLNIGMIGFGPFSQFLAKTMVKQGHLIRATSRSDYSAHLGAHFFRDMEEFMGLEHDVIMICTSILSVSEVVKSIPFHCLKKPTLFVDVLSVKEHPRQILLQEVPEDSDLVCTHPMFGPESGKEGWKDLNFMYERVRVRDEDLCSSFLKIFECEGCKMIEMTCEEHDRLAAQSQFVTHTIGRILSEMQITNTPIDTKGFEKLVQVKKSISNDSFDLYSGLFIHNRFAKQQMKNLESALQRVKGSLEARMKKDEGSDIMALLVLNVKIYEVLFALVFSVLMVIHLFSRMGGRKQKKKINLDWATKESCVSFNHSAPAKNLRKTDLGAVIFGTTNNTINECLSRQLFGLPVGHYSYIKNIKQGLVLFLFNYSDRKLHGIFEAAGPGQLNIDRYAWVADGNDTGYTRYPAQVKICVRQLCHPLSEEQFQPIIAPNYYESKHFHFELDHDQTKKLVALFTSSPMNSSISTKWKNLYASLSATSKRQECKAPMITDLRQELPENVNQITKVSYASALGQTTTTVSSSKPTGKWSALFTSESGYETINDNERGQESQHVGTSSGQTREVDSSPHANTTRDELPLNQECADKGDFLQADTWEESHWVDEAEWDQTWASDLNPQANTTTTNAYVMQGNTWEESEHISPTSCEVKHGQPSDVIGQHFTNSSSPQPLDGILDFNLSLSTEMIGSGVVENHKKDSSLVPKRLVETSTNLQTLVAKLTQEFEEIKGSRLKEIVKINRLEQELDASKLEIQQLRNRVSILESGSRSIVDPAKWIPRPPLYWKNINVAGASIKDRLFVVGGANGPHYSSEVEYLDMNIGKWFPARSMQSKRSAPAAAELNNVLYVSGGYDGVSYLSSVERFDPREEAWCKIPNMNARKGCHSMVVLNEKLFTIGGFSEDRYLATVEYLDTRMGAWVEAESMNVSRGNFGAFVLGGKLLNVTRREVVGRLLLI
ncbi:hypothetical protein L1987_35871 [Smallanthus sonchifolius]|uniref:Uncharacterized protein n=1 Tax=Smallanthus sonchifolius TaxID=185202 RepID=A0ACB9HDA3_9ASTR|nr:hypothetical protein L1987_35871 [Smallanthus sonchifolius]